MRWKSVAIILTSSVLLAVASVSSLGEQGGTFEFTYPDGSIGSTFCYTEGDGTQPTGQRIDIAFGPAAIEIDGAQSSFIWSGWTGGDWLFRMPCEEKAHETFFFLRIDGKYEAPDYVVTFFEDDPSWADEEGAVSGHIKTVFIFPMDCFEAGVHVLAGTWISSEKCEDCESGEDERRYERSITLTVLY